MVQLKNNCLLIQTDKYTVQLHDVVVTDDNKFNRRWISLYGSFLGAHCGRI